MKYPYSLCVSENVDLFQNNNKISFCLYRDPSEPCLVPPEPSELFLPHGEALTGSKLLGARFVIGHRTVALRHALNGSALCRVEIKKKHCHLEKAK